MSPGGVSRLAGREQQSSLLALLPGKLLQGCLAQDTSVKKEISEYAVAGETVNSP